MKNTFGNSITITLFGESHGEKIGAVLDGVAPGIEINYEYIKSKLALRKPFGSISTGRVENDDFEIASGMFNGYTTGAPICILIKNSNTHSSDYQDIKDNPRPSHADYTAKIKYNGFNDYRGGGHFSGRLTAPIVCASAILQYALEKKGIYIGSHICYMQGIEDCELSSKEDILKLGELNFPVLSDKASTQMMEIINDVSKDGDSVGGVLETLVLGMPKGVGEPWFDSLESVLSHALFSIPAVKGVEFGLGFGFADLNGELANDQFILDNGEIKTQTNNNGGINGGISNGMPIKFRSVIKPTPSIYKEQKTVNMATMTERTLQIKGRHDPAIIHRARVVVDSLTAFVLADMLCVKFGTDYLTK